MGNTVTFSISGQIVLISICAAAIVLLAYVVVLQKKICQDLSRIAEGKRLSAILKIEGKKISSLPKDSEPEKKEVLRKTLAKMNEVSKKDYEPDTKALLILDAALTPFLETESRQEIKKAFSRLIVNGDMEKIETFLREVINQL